MNMIPYGEAATDPATITDEQLDEMIQDAVSATESPETIDFDSFQTQSESFLQLTKTLNQKLIQIARLLDKGLRDEAIQQAGLDGRILTVYQRLDFPEREAYQDLIEEFGFARPPELNHDAAAQLNSSFALVGDLKQLLKNHRLLALGRAPITDRIAAMNALAVADPDNPIWEEDSKTFQNHRLQQIQMELTRATKDNDADVIDQLDRELRTIRWSIPLPQKLVTQVSTLQAAHHESRTRAAIESEIEPLVIAFSEFDVDAGSAAADRIRALSESINMQSDDPLLVPVTDALHWIDEYRDNERTAAENRNQCDQFVRLLDSSDDRNRIERAYQRVRLLGDALPDELRLRAEERLESLDLIARRRTMIRIAAIAAGLLLVLGTATTGGVWWYSESKAMALEKDVQSLVDAKSWDAADTLLAKQSIGIRSRNGMVKNRVAIDDALRLESERLNEFASVLESLETDTTMEPQPALVRRLGELAKTTEELEMVKRQESISLEKKLTNNAAINRELEAELQLLQNHTERLSMEPSNAVEARGLIRKLIAFQAKLTEISPHLKSQAQELSGRCEKCIRGIESAARQKSMVDQITKAVGNKDDYASKLQSFAKQFPESPLSNDFESANERVSEIDAALQVAELFDAKAFRSTVQASPEEAKAWLDQVQDLVKAGKSACWLPLLETKRKHLTKIANIPEAIQTLEQIGGSDLLKELYEYRFSDGVFLSATRRTLRSLRRKRN
jgi:hypothetical protein